MVPTVHNNETAETQQEQNLDSLEVRRAAVLIVAALPFELEAGLRVLDLARQIFIESMG